MDHSRYPFALLAILLLGLALPEESPAEPRLVALHPVATREAGTDDVARVLLNRGLTLQLLDQDDLPTTSYPLAPYPPAEDTGDPEEPGLLRWQAATHDLRCILERFDLDQPAFIGFGVRPIKGRVLVSWELTHRGSGETVLADTTEHRLEDAVARFLFFGRRKPIARSLREALIVQATARLSEEIVYRTLHGE